MDFNVYFLDDDASDITITNGKWSLLDPFITHLSDVYVGHTFRRGAQDDNNSPHNDWLSTQSDLIYTILQEPNALVLLDVRMASMEHLEAAVTLWGAADALMLGDQDWRTLDTVTSDSTRLAGAIITLGRHFGTRILWVTTQTENPELFVNLSSLAPHIPWTAPLPAQPWSDAQTVDKLNRIILAHYLNPFLFARSSWNKLGQAAMMAQWQVAGLPTKELFPLGAIAGIDYHNLKCQGGHFSNPSVANEAIIDNLFAGTAFLNLCTDYNQKLALVKSATRGNQIPVFVVNYLFNASIKCTNYEAISWSGRWQAPDLIMALQIVSKCVNDYTGQHRFTLGLTRGIDILTVKLILVGNIDDVASIQTALQMGPVRRAMEPGRNGNPGELTLALDVLGPSYTHCDQANVRTLTVLKQFSVVNL